MKQKAETLRDYAAELGFGELAGRFEAIARQSDADATLTLPLVGEFSAGKTTLVNALTDGITLETASRPTTATIYTVHFGSDRCRAEVHGADGTVTEISAADMPGNDDVATAEVVDVYDTSRRVPSGIVLVDTPGLSSANAEHSQTLVEFLPLADAILLVSDINQQLTRTLTDFAATISLSGRPMYLVLTHCDTKTEAETAAAVDYINSNSGLPLRGIACVSAPRGDVGKLTDMLGRIQVEKTAILAEVNGRRLRDNGAELLARIDALLGADNGTDALDAAIATENSRLNGMRSAVDELVDSLADGLADIRRGITRTFEDTVADRLDAVVTAKSDDYDADAAAAIDNLSAVCFNEYRRRVLELLRDAAAHRASSSDIGAENLPSLNISELRADSMAYNLNLNSAGHEYDSRIATGLKVAAVAAAVAVTAGAAGAAGAGAAGTAGKAMVVADVADTATDIGSIIANHRHIARLKKMSRNLDQLNSLDRQAGRTIGREGGMVQTVVGLVTERTMGKPQRRRAIRNYIDTTLSPAFADELWRITVEMNTSITEYLNSRTAAREQEMRRSLEEMRRRRRDNDDEYRRQAARLRAMRADIESLFPNIC